MWVARPHANWFICHSSFSRPRYFTGSDCIQQHGVSSAEVGTVGLWPGLEKSPDKHLGVKITMVRVLAFVYLTIYLFYVEVTVWKVTLMLCYPGLFFDLWDPGLIIISLVMYFLYVISFAGPVLELLGSLLEIPLLLLRGILKGRIPLGTLGRILEVRLHILELQFRMLLLPDIEPRIVGLRRIINELRRLFRGRHP